MSAVTPLIIAVAPNGARRVKADHPAIPLTAEDMADVAAEAQRAGAAVLHLHVRDGQGRHLLDAAAYRASIRAVRRAVGDEMVVQVTTEAAGRYLRDEQMAVARAVVGGPDGAEAVSLAVRELVPDAEAEAGAARFYADLWRERVFLQHILYSAADVERYRDLKARGVIPGGQVLFVLGRYSGSGDAQPAELLPFLSAWGGETASWMACAFGARENACALAAAALGGHARVGFENNMLLADGQPAADNAALVEQLAAGAPYLGRPLADADATRALWAQP